MLVSVKKKDLKLNHLRFQIKKEKQSKQKETIKNRNKQHNTDRQRPAETQTERTAAPPEPSGR